MKPRHGSLVHPIYKLRLAAKHPSWLSDSEPICKEISISLSQPSFPVWESLQCRTKKTCSLNSLIISMQLSINCMPFTVHRDDGCGEQLLHTQHTLNARCPSPSLSEFSKGAWEAGRMTPWDNRASAENGVQQWAPSWCPEALTPQPSLLNIFSGSHNPYGKGSDGRQATSKEVPFQRGRKHRKDSFTNKFCFFLPCLQTEPRLLWMLGRSATPELYPQSKQRGKNSTKQPLSENQSFHCKSHLLFQVNTKTWLILNRNSNG